MAQATIQSKTKTASEIKPAAKASAENPRANNFNFIRFALAVMVIFGHSYSMIQKTSDNEPLTRLTRGQMFSGELAVDCFFIISGFLILQSWLYSRSAGDYLRKRALRIYPGYIVCALLCIFVVGPIGMGSASAYFHTMPWKHNLHALVFLNQLEIHPFIHLPIEIVNGSLWTISEEFVCYLALAALGLLGILRKRRLVLGLFAASLAGYLFQLARGWNKPFALPLHLGGDITAWPRLFTYFLAGMCYYLFRDKIRYTRAYLWLAGLALTVSCVTNSLALTLPICGTYLLFYFVFHPTLHAYEFGRKCDLSYGIYLYGWPAQQLILNYFLRDLNPVTLALCAIPVTCGAAYLSWILIEKPFLKLKPRSQTAAQTAAAQA